MKRLTVLVVCLLLPLLFVSSAAKQFSGPLEILITAGERGIQYATVETVWSNLAANNENPFATNKNSQKGDIPYIPLNETIKIAVKGEALDAITLKDYILDSEFKIKYRKNYGKEYLSEDLDVTFQSGTASFSLKPNWAVLLSSYSGDYAPGAVIRGFCLTCSWGKTSRVYTFVLRTDP